MRGQSVKNKEIVRAEIKSVCRILIEEDDKRTGIHEAIIRVQRMRDKEWDGTDGLSFGIPYDKYVEITFGGLTMVNCSWTTSFNVYHLPKTQDINFVVIEDKNCVEIKITALEDAS